VVHSGNIQFIQFRRPRLDRTLSGRHKNDGNTASTKYHHNDLSFGPYIFRPHQSVVLSGTCGRASVNHNLTSGDMFKIREILNSGQTVSVRMTQ
jgi:hypothetical protein